MQTITCEVTYDDIVKGKPHNPYSCPIARSLRRKTHKKIFVGYFKTRIGNRWYDTPRNAQKFIQRFDAQLPCSKITVILDSPIKN